MEKIINIKPNPNNPRIIKDDKFKKLVNSLREFPEMLEKRPLVCFTDTDKKLVVLGGNMRLKAAQELGLKELPVILADDWTEEQKKQFLIKDNVGFGEWDWDDLANNWDAEELEEWGVVIPGIDTEEFEAEEKSGYDLQNNWFLNISFENENECKDWYEKLIKEGLICKIIM